MQIKAEYLDYVFELISIHQPATIDGEYDGSIGSLTLTFTNDELTYEVDFVYTGSSYNGFREILCEAAGQTVKDHNYNIGIPNRDEFIANVTE